MRVLLATMFALCMSLSEICVGADLSSELCQAIQSAVTRNHLATRDLTGLMFCEAQKEVKEYVAFALRYRREVAKEGVGSNLVGWFAVRRSDKRVFYWDITSERLVGQGYSLALTNEQNSSLARKRESRFSF